MQERLLQFIWQFQYFNKASLDTLNGEPVSILSPGTFNTNQGPDFLSAKIKIGDTIWAGNIELHVNTSDWDLHKHSADKNYNNIILHVVWHNDIGIKDSGGNNLPTIELQERVSKILLRRYEELMNAPYFIPCEKQISQVNELTLNAWKQRLLVERLQRKAMGILQHLEQNNFHWEEMFWWMLAKNFGTKINGDAFEKIAQSIPLNILAKHKNQVQQLEALLFGQAGLLDKKFEEDYPKMLQKEYHFLAKKYSLTKPNVPLFYLRMRPANFPTIRLAQLAMLVHNSHHLFSKIKEANDVSTISTSFDVEANDYWHYHYTIDEPAIFKKKIVGEQMIQNILINTVAPVLFAYGHHHKEESFEDKAIRWLEEIRPEKNVITKGFEALKLIHKSAFDSQAFIQMKNEYCNKRRCLECAVGNSILKKYVQPVTP